MAKLPVQEPTFWPIDGRVWLDRRAASQGMSVSAESGLRLAARPDGPLALDWPDGSVGGLGLPLGMALDRDFRLYVLDPEAPWRIRRFEPSREAFEPLPGLGGRGREPRQFDRPANIGLLRGNLYVADRGNARMQVFDLRTLALRHLWEGVGTPLDVAAGPRFAWMLTEDGRVYRHRPGGDWPVFVLRLTGAPDWGRILVDLQGRLYVLRVPEGGDPPALHVFDVNGEPLEVVQDGGDVHDRFAPPAVRLFFNLRGATRPAPGQGYFCLPAELAALCDARVPLAPPAPERPLALCLPAGGVPPAGAQIFDRRGRAVELDPAELAETPAYGDRGVWISKALDSDRYRCQWHRVALDMATLPAGTRVIVSTLSADAEAPQPAEGDPRWVEGFRLAGTLDRPGAAPEEPDDFLVQSRPGQYLWLKIVLEGDGFGTPALHKLQVHYPRQSYLDYLPAIFAEEGESRWFLERFLSIFQTEWDELEGQIADLPALFDPDAVPGGPLLDQLARWIALPLEGTWDAEQRRNLLRLVRRFYPQRGTAAGLRLFLQATLQNITGLSPEGQGLFPVLVEGFRRRDHAFLAAGGAPGTGTASYPLWSPAVVDRLQTGAHARAGEVRLVSTNDPARDVFHTYAHRFQVYLPAGWVRSAADESMVRRALDAEKPAHTGYDLCLVPARFRVGVQSTVGLDTVVGGIPVARLACPQELKDAAPSRPPSQRLGYDTVLAGRAATTARLPYQKNRL
jgi:phage tail-like protein